jgi:hypothetical protein
MARLQPVRTTQPKLILAGRLLGLRQSNRGFALAHSFIRPVLRIKRAAYKLVRVRVPRVLLERRTCQRSRILHSAIRKSLEGRGTPSNGPVRRGEVGSLRRQTGRYKRDKRSQRQP